MHIGQHKCRYQYMCDNILAYHTYLNQKIIYLESFLSWNIHTGCAVNPVWNSECCNIHIQHIRLRSDCSQIRFVYQIRPDRESVCTVICKWQYLHGLLWQQRRRQSLCMLVSQVFKTEAWEKMVSRNVVFQSIMLSGRRANNLFQRSSPIWATRVRCSCRNRTWIKFQTTSKELFICFVAVQTS